MFSHVSIEFRLRREDERVSLDHSRRNGNGVQSRPDNKCKVYEFCKAWFQTTYLELETLFLNESRLQPVASFRTRQLSSFNKNSAISYATNFAASVDTRREKKENETIVSTCICLRNNMHVRIYPYKERERDGQSVCVWETERKRKDAS